MKYYLYLEEGGNNIAWCVDSNKNSVEIAYEYADSLSKYYDKKTICVSETGFNHKPVFKICVDFARNNGSNLKKFMNRLQFE